VWTAATDAVECSTVPGTRACHRLVRVPAAASFPSLDAFLAGVERRALRRAELATRDRDEALDIVQDAMLSLARSYGTRPSTEWPGLFHRILVNRIRDWQRARKLRQRLFFWEPDDSDTDVPDPQGSDGEQDLQGAQLAGLLQQALLQLPARQRETFELRIWEGLTAQMRARCSEEMTSVPSRLRPSRTWT